MNAKLNEWQPELVELVSSVIGIGKRATADLIISIQGFKHTYSHQQLISFTGLCSKEYTSGSSVRGKVRICKFGNSKLRNTLYMRALNAEIIELILIKKTIPIIRMVFKLIIYGLLFLNNHKL